MQRAVGGGRDGLAGWLTVVGRAGWLWFVAPQVAEEEEEGDEEEAGAAAARMAEDTAGQQEEQQEDVKVRE